MTKLNLALLLLNSFVLGGLMVLMTFRGPALPTVLLAVGAAGMMIGRIGAVLHRPPTLTPPSPPAHPRA
jgi:hypothetical protein